MDIGNYDFIFDILKMKINIFIFVKYFNNLLLNSENNYGNNFNNHLLNSGNNYENNFNNLLLDSENNIFDKNIF